MVSTSKKIQTAQNKCIRFCLNLGNRSHIGIDEFKNINWLPTAKRFNQCVCVSAYKFCNDLSPTYMSEIFSLYDSTHSTRKMKHRLNQPNRLLDIGHKGISHIGPRMWNDLDSNLKGEIGLNTFKHKIKNNFFKGLQERKDLMP
jgi:hypothetical protein